MIKPNSITTHADCDASGIAVECSFTKLVNITELIPHPRNPNKHGADQIGLLAKVIKHQGWRAPVVVSTRSGFVIAGHGRLEAATALGVDQVPVDFQDFKDEATEWAHLIADNKIAELADLSEADVLAILNELEGKIDLDLTGYNPSAIDALRATHSIPDSNIAIDEDALAVTNNECPKCGFKWQK
jgi:hypothetical protein